MTIPEIAKKVFSWLTFDVYHWEQEMFDGSFKTFEKLKRNDGVDIVAITKKWKIIILKEQQPWREPFYWLVWWSWETWERPLYTAKRELLEETGLESDDWELFWEYSYSSRIQQKSHLYIARNCEKKMEQNLDSWEKIQIIECDWEEFKSFVIDEKFRVSKFSLELLREIYLWREDDFKKRIFWE